MEPGSSINLGVTSIKDPLFQYQLVFFNSDECLQSEGISMLIFNFPMDCF